MKHGCREMVEIVGIQQFYQQNEYINFYLLGTMRSQATNYCFKQDY